MINFGAGTQAIGFAVALVGALGGGMTWVDDHFASKDDVLLVDMRLEQQIEADSIKDTQARIWMLEDRYINKNLPMPPSVAEEYRQLKADQQQSRYRLNGIQRQLNEMQYQRSKQPMGK